MCGVTLAARLETEVPRMWGDGALPSKAQPVFCMVFNFGDYFYDR